MILAIMILNESNAGFYTFNVAEKTILYFQMLLSSSSQNVITIIHPLYSHISFLNLFFQICSMKKAGFGTRVLNFIIDTLLIFGITYGINSWWDFQVMYWHYTFIPFYAFFWAIMFVYYTLFEIIFKRTPAKWLSVSKVVNKAGNKPALWQILVRSLIRLTIIDCFFIPFLDKPLHDYLSKTEVVEA